MLTDEQMIAILPEWAADLVQSSVGEFEYEWKLAHGWATSLLARQRDRRRLRAVLRVAKREKLGHSQSARNSLLYQEFCNAAKGEVLQLRRRYKDLRRSAAAWKRAAKKWYDMANYQCGAACNTIAVCRRDLAAMTEERGSFQEGAGVLEKALQRTETDLLKSQVQLEEARREWGKMHERLAAVRKVIETQRDKYESISPVILVVSLDEIEAALRGGEGE